MRIPFTLVDLNGVRRDYQAEVDGPVTLADLIGAAGSRPPYDGAPVWVDGRLAHLDQAVESSGLRAGGTVAFSSPGPGAPDPTADPAAHLHVAVVGGPLAGAIFGLPPGPAVAGRSPECDIRLPEPAVSSRHLRLTTSPDGAVTAEDLGSRNGILVDGEAPAGPVPLRPGQRVVLGQTVLELRAGMAADAVLHAMAAGREVRRPPRLTAPPPVPRIEWPLEPAGTKGPTVPLASAALPLVLGGVMYLATRQVLMLLFIVMTPMLVVANFVTTKRSGKKEHRQAVARYREADQEARAALAAAVAAEKADREQAHPDPASVLATATGPRHRLWERRAADPDVLDMRFGLGRLEARAKLELSDPFAKEQPPPASVDDVPVVCSLAESGVIGVAAPAAVSGPLAQWLVAQQVVLSGPADVQVAVLAEPRSGSDERWDWARWLPHVAPVGPTDAGGADPTGARARGLVDLIEGRRREREQYRGGPPVEQGWPWVLVVLDPAHDLRRVPGVDVVLQQGPAVRVVSLCVETAESYLPPECRAVLAADDAGHATLKRAGEAPLEGITADRVPDGWAETVGRRLAPLVDPEVRSVAGQIPGAARLVDLLPVREVSPAGIVELWRAGGRSTSGVVGVGAEGPFSLDIRADGPHGLVAGTTGAGKSEFLQTLVASLAVTNRPDALNFLLVDYKGGSAFRDCSLLPHTVGVVTDLDPHLTERALVSLSAELKRREELLAEAESKDIDDYIAIGEPVGPLPRLLIVIDEFAGLVAELPDFVTGLVGIAQRGRSLGIHLVLATQRPSGVVSPEIRANTNLRVALRVTSPAESVDIIDAPDAARISPATPGRAYAVTGHSTLALFQAGRVGGPAAAAEAGRRAQLGVAPLDWSTAGRPPAMTALRPARQPAGVDPSDTDLSRLVASLNVAAEAIQAGHQRQPWLAPLTDVLPLADLGPVATAPAGEVRAAPIGLVDLPAAQRQEPLAYSLPDARHLIVAGSPGTGRTTVLRTLAVALTTANPPDDLWLYVLDCGGGELRRLGALPHCGAVVTRAEPDRADRMLSRLHAEMGRRLDLLARQGFNDLAEQRAGSDATDRLPYIVVLIDRWDGFMSTFDPVDNGRLTDTVLDLVREGGAVGIRVVVTGDRALLIGKVATLVEDRLCLALAEPSDYAMAGLDPRRVPANMAPGRAMRSGDQAEVQVAVIGDAPTGAAQAAAMAELVASWSGWNPAPTAGRTRRVRPFRIDALPDQVGLDEVRAMAAGARRSPYWALVGVGGDEVGPAGVDLDGPGGFVVAGPRRTGRSTALTVMAESLLDAGTPVLAFCPRSSPLRRLAGRPGVLAVINGEDPPVADALAIVNDLTGPLAVFVDDAPLLHNQPVSELLEAMARDGRDQGHVMVIAGGAEELSRPMRGFIFELRQARSGLLLCPESHLSGEVIGARLARSAVFSRPVGRGVLVVDERQGLVQVPNPDPAVPSVGTGV